MSATKRTRVTTARSSVLECHDMLGLVCSFLWVDELLCFKCTTRCACKAVGAYWNKQLPKRLRQQLVRILGVPIDWIDKLREAGGAVTNVLLFQMMCGRGDYSFGFRRAPSTYNEGGRSYRHEVVQSPRTWVQQAVIPDGFKRILLETYIPAGATGIPAGTIIGCVGGVATFDESTGRVGVDRQQVVLSRGSRTETSTLYDIQNATLPLGWFARGEIGSPAYKSSLENIVVAMADGGMDDFIVEANTTAFDMCSFDGLSLRVRHPECFIDRASDYFPRRFVTMNPVDLGDMTGEFKKTQEFYAKRGFKVTKQSKRLFEYEPLLED